MLHSACPAPAQAGPGFFSRPVGLHGVALGLSDHLVVVAPDGTVVALNPGARRLWEALEAGCTADDLIEASIREGDLPHDVARANVTRALASLRALGLLDSVLPGAEPPPCPMPVGARSEGRTPALDAIY